MDDDVDPFEERQFGPQGWTDELVAALDEFFVGPEEFGIRVFAGVPIDVAERLAGALAAQGVEGVESSGASEVVAVARILGSDATVTGRAVSRDRGDERIEFVAAELDVTTMSEGELAALTEKLWAANAAVHLDDAPDQRRLSAY